MKKFFTIAVILSLVLLANLATVSAQGPSGSYVSGVSCVDVSGNGAAITVAVYDSASNGGASLGSFSDNISAGSNIQYFTGSAGDSIGDLMSAGSSGSAVVSSDNEVICSLNTQTSGGTLRVGTSNGAATSATASTVYVPQAIRLLDNGSNVIFASYFAIQNAGGTAATNATARFYDATGSEITAAAQTVSIPPNSSHIFYQDTNTNLPTNFNGSAAVTSDDGTKLAGTVVLFDGSSTLLTYDAFAAGATNVIGPRFVKNLSDTQLYSGLACQNLSSSATNITATFSILDQSTSSTVSDSVTKTGVGQNQSFLLSATNFAGDSASSTLNAIPKGFGSVTVSASGGATIACTFNENATTAGNIDFSGNGSTYNGLDASSATNTIIFPQVVDLGGSSFQGGFQYANTTGTAATCSHEYATSSGSLGTITGKALAANGSNSVSAPSDMATSGVTAIENAAGSFNGSVTVTCDQAIVGIYNLAGLPFGGDSFTTNTGFNSQ